MQAQEVLGVGVDGAEERPGPQGQPAVEGHLLAARHGESPSPHHRERPQVEREHDSQKHQGAGVQ